MASHPAQRLKRYRTHHLRTCSGGLRDPLQTLAETGNLTVITVDTLREAGFINKNQLVKILGNGELTAKLEVSANAFSKSAIAKIEAVGGTATTI